MAITLKPEQEYLVIDNSRLIYDVLKNFNYDYNEKEDLFSTGMLGLINAAATYDQTKDIKFATYAYVCIKNEINNYFGKIDPNEYTKKHLEDKVYSKSDTTILDITEDQSQDYMDMIYGFETFNDIEYALEIILNEFRRNEKIAMLLRLHGMKINKIAKHINVNTSQRVSQLCITAFRKLKESVENNSDNRVTYLIRCVYEDNKLNIFFTTNSSNAANDIKQEIEQKFSRVNVTVSVNVETIKIAIPRNNNTFYILALLVPYIDVDVQEIVYKNEVLDPITIVKYYLSIRSLSFTIDQLEKVFPNVKKSIVCKAIDIGIKKRLINNRDNRYYIKKRNL